MTSEDGLRILRFARDHGPVHAGQLAEDLGVDTSAAYRQLEALTARGLLATESVTHGPGRPRKMYSLTPDGLEAFRRDYGLLLNALMSAVQARHGRKDLLTTLESIGNVLGAPLAHGAFAERLDGLERLYNDLGFEASIQRQGSTAVLVQRNCPFLKSARADPAGMCECLDEGIIRAAIPKAKVELRSSLALGHTRCRHEIRT